MRVMMTGGVSCSPATFWREIASATSMPDSTRANGVYLPSRWCAGLSMMKKWMLPLFGWSECAMPTIPRSNATVCENSSGTFQ